MISKGVEKWCQKQKHIYVCKQYIASENVICDNILEIIMQALNKNKLTDIKKNHSK